LMFCVSRKLNMAMLNGVVEEVVVGVVDVDEGRVVAGVVVVNAEPALGT
jgi:hypothetical protein